MVGVLTPTQPGANQMKATNLLFLVAAPVAAASLPAGAADSARAAPGLTASGEFCEVIWAGEAWQRVSCFSLRQGAEGVELDGVAFSWARVGKEGAVVAPELATWRLERVLSYEAETQTLRYAHTGKMTNTERDFSGETSVSFDFDASGGTTTGWYGDPKTPTRFRLLPLGELEGCVGARVPALPRQERFALVARAAPERLAACLPEPPPEWLAEANPAAP